MPRTISPPPAQYLRTDAIRGGMDLLMFANRSHLSHADQALAEQGLGRAHHRVIYILSRNPGSTVTEILEFLGITKQSLGRVMKDLKNKGMVEARPGKRDRRNKLVFLTVKGYEIENVLFERMHENMARAYAAAGEDAVGGYWTLTQHLMSPATHENFLTFNKRSIKVE